MLLKLRGKKPILLMYSYLCCGKRCYARTSTFKLLFFGLFAAWIYIRE